MLLMLWLLNKEVMKLGSLEVLMLVSSVTVVKGSQLIILAVVIGSERVREV